MIPIVFCTFLSSASFFVKAWIAKLKLQINQDFAVYETLEAVDEILISTKPSRQIYFVSNIFMGRICGELVARRIKQANPEAIVVIYSSDEGEVANLRYADAFLSKLRPNARNVLQSMITLFREGKTKDEILSHPSVKPSLGVSP